ncbi:MAG TPA: HAMP domain-containing sensor histidine kinase [Longimicrobiales bacterium]
MPEVAKLGLNALLGEIARTPDSEFDLISTLRGLGQNAIAYTGATAVQITRDIAGQGMELLVAIGHAQGGTPKRLPIVVEGEEVGAFTLFGVNMFGPATAERTQLLVDLAAMALERASRNQEDSIDPARYRLITGVGHNLRNTLGAASGYMQLVDMQGALTAQQQEYIGRSRRAINAAVTLIVDLLELTRADAGKLTFDREPVHIPAVAREAVRKHQDNAASRNVRVIFDDYPKHLVLFTDSSYVQQVVDVLVYNAVRYSPENTTVRVAVSVREGRRASDPANIICVSVSDEGPGIPEAEQVFEEVHRVEQRRGNVRFRLAICRRVARLLGGDLTVETVADQGSTFTLWLPAPANSLVAAE